MLTARGLPGKEPDGLCRPTVRLGASGIAPRRSIMQRIRKCALAVLAVATLLASGTWVGTALARGDNSPERDKIALGENEVKQLVLLMDKDQNGKVSEQEFMNFMEAEFQRLDKDKSGELDVKELQEPQIRVRPFTAFGK
jgi:hypothetical protein